MKRCSLFCVGIWPFLFLPLLALLILLFFKWHAIEEVVANNVRQATADSYPWLKVQTFNRGREVLLYGKAPQAMQDTDIEQLIAQAKQAYGARSVVYVGENYTVDDISAIQTSTIDAPQGNENTLSTNVTAMDDGADSGSLPDSVALQPAFVMLADTERTIVLSGVVNSQSTSNNIEADTRRVFAERTIHNELVIDSAVGEFNGLGNSLKILNSIDAQGSVAIRADQLSISGQVSSATEKESVSQLANDGFNGTVNNLLKVVAPLCEDAIKELLHNSKVNFATGKAELEPDSYALLKSIASAASGCKKVQFEISGHTDSTGDEAFNLMLSKQRAETVFTHLVNVGGLSASRFTTRGAGSSEPVADNASGAGRASNRRIEFKVTN